MNSVRQLWLKWKMLRLPWRRQFLAGQDLHGLTYWEFRGQGDNSHRMRRMVKGPRNLHHADVPSFVSPLWHQWLRHTRFDAPSMEEQQMDVTRQIQLKHNARLADERWASKKRYIEKPREKDEEQTGTRGMEAQRQVADEVRGKMEDRAGVPPDAAVNARERVQHQQGASQHQQKPDPWEQERQKQKQTATNPSGAWQPEAWTPPPRRR